MSDTLELAEQMFKPISLVYCDYIADRIRRLFGPDDNVIESVGRVEWDLHPTGGYMLTTKKTIRAVGRNGRRYRITIEEDLT